MKGYQVQRQALDRIECLALMRSVPVGRIVFTERALPAIQPVGFALDDDRGGRGDRCVVISTAPGSGLAAATRDSVVAFQTDAFDADGDTGWSVTVIGFARSACDQIIRISCGRVTGYRSVGTGPAPCGGGPAGREMTFGTKARTLVPTDPRCRTRRSGHAL